MMLNPWLLKNIRWCPSLNTFWGFMLECVCSIKCCRGCKIIPTKLVLWCRDNVVYQIVLIEESTAVRSHVAASSVEWQGETPEEVCHIRHQNDICLIDPPPQAVGFHQRSHSTAAYEPMMQTKVSVLRRMIVIWPSLFYTIYDSKGVVISPNHL